MLFSRIASVFVTLATVGIAFATPAPKAETDLKKRQNLNSILNIVSELETTAGNVLPQISALNLGSMTSTSEIAPLISQLTSALDSATNSLGGGGLLGGLGLKARSDEENEIATRVATVTNNIATTLNPLKSNALFVPVFGGLIGALDIAINRLLITLGGLIHGLLFTISGLLVGVAGVLDGLSLTLVLATLGL